MVFETEKKPIHLLSLTVKILSKSQVLNLTEVIFAVIAGVDTLQVIKKKLILNLAHNK